MTTLYTSLGSERNATIRALAPHYTLEELGQQFGLSRERIRQIAHGLPRHRRWGIVGASADPIVVMTLIRDPLMTSYAYVAAALGYRQSVSVRQTVVALGMSEAVSRLFLWRKQSARRREIVATIRRIADDLGRSPTHTEMAVACETAAFAMDCKRLWRDGARAAYAAAGVAPRRVGGPGHVGSSSRAAVKEKFPSVTRHIGHTASSTSAWRAARATGESARPAIQNRTCRPSG